MEGFRLGKHMLVVADVNKKGNMKSSEYIDRIKLSLFENNIRKILREGN